MLNSLSGIMMVSGLAFMGTAPFVADYIVLAAGLFGLGLALARRDGLLTAWPTRLLLLAVVLIAITLPFVCRGELDLLPLLVFAAFLLAPGIAVLLQRSPEWLKPQAFALVCLVGAVTACLVGLAESAAVPGARIGVGNNPIHYGGIATVLGFMALIGTVSGRSPLRLIFLLGPVAALAAVLLSGSRGPLLAWVALAGIGGVLVLWWNRHDRLLLTLVATSVVGAGGLLATNADMRAISHLNAFVSSLLSGEAANSSDAVRAVMLNAAGDVLGESPIYGIGLGQIMDFAATRYPDIRLSHLENYHNDVANFAAAGGLLGVLAYLLVMLTPLALLWTAAARQNQALVLGSVLLVVSYGVLGLTNAMFGVLPQTMLFVLILGYLMALQRAGSADPDA